MKSNNNFFTNADNFKTIDTFRLVYLIVSVISFLLTEIGRFVYRPFIYESNINDFGLADSIGNLGGIVVQVFAGLVLLNPPFNKGFRLIAFLIIGYIVYEFAQQILPRGVFDINDIYATLIGGIFSLLLYSIIHIGIKQNTAIYKF